MSISNSKRIEKLEMKLGIEKDNPGTDYWKEINSCVCECLSLEMAGKTFSLPDYLKFAEHIFYRVLNFFRKLYKNVLEERRKKRAGIKEEDKATLKINGVGWLYRLEYMEITLYKILTQIGSTAPAKFLKDKLFLSCRDLSLRTIRYIYKVEFPNEPQLAYTSVCKFKYW